MQPIQSRLIIFYANKIGEAIQTKIYQTFIHVVLSIIARDYLDDTPIAMRTIRTRTHQLRALLQRLELMQVMTRDNEIRGTRLEVTAQHMGTVQAARRMCNKLDILRVQGIENMLEGSFDEDSYTSGRFNPRLRGQGGKLESCNVRHCV